MKKREKEIETGSGAFYETLVSGPERAGRYMGGVGRFSVREQAQRGYLNLELAIIHAK